METKLKDFIIILGITLLLLIIVAPWLTGDPQGWLAL